MAKLKKLTAKQKKFADEYIISGNITESAKKAGYSERTAAVIGSENLNKPNIKAYIDERMKELDEQSIADQKEVLQIFTKIARQELTEEVTELDPTTGEFVVIEKKPNISEVIKAGAELMKRYPTAIESEKARLEIEKLKQEIEPDAEQEDKLVAFADQLEEAFKDAD